MVLLLFEKELRTDELQFGFQQKTSANMCTWLVVETIDYFQRNGSEVYACVMDLSKAFDRIKHSDLFWKLLKKGRFGTCSLMKPSGLKSRGIYLLEFCWVYQEPLLGTPHIMLSLFKRFLNFINSIKNSSNSILNNMLDLIKK